MTEHQFDIAVIGGGPAGQKAAIQGAKAGKTVVLIERDVVGGSCVHHGTIPSKTFREAAVSLAGFRRRTSNVFEVTVREDLQVQSLLRRLREVVGAHERYMDEQLQRNHVEAWRGRARFLSPHLLSVQAPGGGERRVQAGVIVIATGSRPRHPPADLVQIDHEHIFDSDSILSLIYLPASLTVIGGGVISSEYASIFAALGVRVTMIDRASRPLSFFDGELTDRFVRAFEASGGRYIGGRSLKEAAWDGVSEVRAVLDDGQEVRSEKMLYALGRVSTLDGLDIDKAGLSVSARGLIEVDEHCRTAVPHVYAAGDVIGPPALASSAMDQGRRAVRHALGMGSGVPPELIPMGIYTIPELSSVGLSEAQAVERHGGAIVGRASFGELARGQIAANEDGMLKLVADAAGQKLLGVQIIGEGAAELIHVGQMALLSQMDVEAFIENIFNFPTLAEGYRVAALDIAKRRP